MSALTDARATLKTDTEAAKQYRQVSDKGRLGLARTMARVRSLFAQHPNVGGKEYPRFEDWVEEVAPGESRVNALTNAGVVAEIIGDLQCVPSDRALTPLYRELSSAKTSDDIAAAEDRIRSLWANALESVDLKRGKAPSEKSVTELVGDGARGPKSSGGKKTGTKQSKATESKDSEPESDPRAVESATKETRRQCEKLVAAGADPAVVAVVLSMTVKLCESHGVSVMYSVTQALKSEGREAAKQATEKVSK